MKSNRRSNRRLVLAEYFPKSLSSRTSVRKLMEESVTGEMDSLEIDFSNISFITRSAAHELISQKQNLEKNQGTLITFIHMSQEISKMLEVVEQSIHGQRPSSSVNILHFEKEKEFEEFLMSK